MSPKTHTEQMPHAGASTVEKYKQERYFRDIYMKNYHINHDKWELIKLFDIIDAHRLEEDFCTYDADVWEVVDDTSGGATVNCSDAVNGVLVVTTDAQDDSRIEITQECECWKLVDCYPLYFEARLYVSDDDQVDWWIGLISGTHLLSGAMNDGVYFKKDDGDAYLDFVTELNGVATETSQIISVSADTWYRLGFYFNGNAQTPRVYYFVIEDTDQPQNITETGNHTTHIVQDEELAAGFGVQNGEAVAKSFYIDYLKCVQKRVIE